MTKINANALPAHSSSRVPLESENLLDIRRQMQASSDFYMEQQSRTTEERNACKQEMSNFLGLVFSHLKENVIITDNPGFNFNEPINAEEPLDEGLIYARDQAEQQLQLLAERAIQIRKQKIQDLSGLITDMITQESRPARELHIAHGELAKQRELTIARPESNQENMERVVQTYSDSIELLANLEKETKHVGSYLDHINRRSEEEQD